MKVVSGCDAESADIIARIYQVVVKAGVFKASSIKVAEAAKIIENTQRDVNIALMNELSKIFDRMNINTYEVLEAAATKWNFLPFHPGLVGGHCIGVDPYYLTYKATALDYVPEVILSGRRINDNMGPYVARRTIQLIKQSSHNNNNGHKLKVLVMGATFKENVSDIRNSKVADIIKELKLFSALVDVIDPHASSEELMHEYKFGLIDKPGNDYDAIILAVPHNDYLNYDEEFFKQHLKPNGVLVDVKGIYRKKIKNIIYWSL